MDIETLVIVRRAAELGGFAAAARALDLDPSKVSRAVGAAEQALGVRLFQRSTRRFAITEAGAAWLARAGPALDELDGAREAARDVAERPKGRVRLTASTAFGAVLLAPLLPALRDAAPKVRFDLILSDANLDLVGEGIDLAIRLAPAPAGDLFSTRLMRTRYRVVASPDYLARTGPPGSPRDLAARDCVLGGPAAYRSHWLFRPRRGEAVFKVDVNGPVTLSNPLALQEAAKAGLGPALLADWLIIDDVRKGFLVDLFPDHDAAATDFDTGAFALYPSRAFLPLAVRVTLDFLKSTLRGRADGA